MASSVRPLPARDRVDACPGALRVHPAADGGLARVRLPGGQLSVDALRTLADAATDLGDGSLELTSRGNVQLRALASGAEVELAARLAAAGLLPSESHERVRNIICSPLSGLDGRGRADVADLATELDRALCATPRLADLPGRFLFAIDDGRGDVAALDADVTVVAVDSERVELLPGGFLVARPAAVQAMLAVAEAFLDEVSRLDGPVWRIAELPDGGVGLVGRLSGLSWPGGLSGPGSTQLQCSDAQLGGISALTLVVLAPLGRLTATQARLLADRAGPRGLRITPWRSVVFIDAPPSAAAELEAAGLGVNPDSPWNRVSACAGRPGCAQALADVQTDARDALDRFPGRRVRWSGCARKCGRPRDTEVDIVATELGYEVTQA